MVAIGKQSVGSTTNLFQGYWSHVEFRPGGYNAAADKLRYLGVVQEGVLEISREDVEYMGTTFPRVVELLTPSQVGMKFSGQIDELHQSNMLIASGGNANVAGALADGYIYPGASCGFGAQEFGTLIARRKRCSTDAPFVMEACLWKTVGSGALSIGGDADVVGSTVEFSALDDSNGDYMDGGQVTPKVDWAVTAADHPLGYVFSPAPAADSTVV